MTATPGAEVGDILLTASYRKEEGDIPAGFAGVFGRIAERYFQRYGDQSDALAAIAAKNHKNGVDNPYAQMRTRPRLRVLPQGEREEPVRGAAAEAHRLLAGLRRRRGAGAGRRGDRARAGQGGALPRGGAGERFPAALAARPHAASRAPREAWQRALSEAGLTLDDLSFVESHDCFTIAELLEYEAMGLTRARPGRARGAGGLDREGRQAAGQSRRAD